MHRALGTTRYASRHSLPGARVIHRRFLSATSELGSYEETLQNLRIGSHTRVIFQGFTGKQATVDATESIAWGTKIVGGVTPGRSDTHLGLPVFPTVRSAVEELNPDATAIYVAAHQAAGAIQEAIEAEIPLIVAVAEHVPLHDMIKIHSILKTQSRSRLVGPNSPGIISAVGKCRIGFQPLSFFSPGSIGIAAKSGTLSYEAVASTTKAGLGQSLCIGVGGDIVPGTSLTEALSVLEADNDTEAIALIGEIGGEDEINAANWIQEYHARSKSPKPIVALIAGRTDPPTYTFAPASHLEHRLVSEFSGRALGHAGAFTVSGQPKAKEKMTVLEEVGVTLIDHPGQFGEALRSRLRPKNRISSPGIATATSADMMNPMFEQRRDFHTSRRPFIRDAYHPSAAKQQIRHLTIHPKKCLDILGSKGIPCAPYKGKGPLRYIAISIDRNTRTPCILACPDPYNHFPLHNIPLPYPLPEKLEPLIRSLLPGICKKIALPHSGPIKKVLYPLLTNLIQMFNENEGVLLITLLHYDNTQRGMKVGSAHFHFDDAASFRRDAEFQSLRDTSFYSPEELEAEKSGLVYIKFSGPRKTIGTLVNGAGLAMNTIDNLQLKAANFLDTGGKATSETVKEAFRIILQDERVQVIFVNIFGGLTKGDMIAEGVCSAFRELDIKIPVVARIRGTKEEEAQKIIEQSGLEGLYAIGDFDQAVSKVMDFGGPEEMATVEGEWDWLKSPKHSVEEE